jgi:hypothetical protein
MIRIESLIYLFEPTIKSDKETKDITTKIIPFCIYSFIKY